MGKGVVGQGVSGGWVVRRLGILWEDFWAFLWYNSSVRKDVVDTDRKAIIDQIIEELVAIGFACVTDYFFMEDGALKLKDNLPKQAGSVIASMESGSKGVKVKFYDKLKALELLGKHFGMFGGKDLLDPKQNNLLEAILAATEGQVCMDDLPELQQAAASGHELVESTRAAGA